MVSRNQLKDLAAFLAVAEEQNFTRAAARLQTSQSALSLVIKRLEESLDIKLLNRTTRNIDITPDGKKLAETLRNSLSIIDDHLLEIRESRNEVSGKIRITCSDYAARNILMPAAKNILKQYPKAQIEIIVGGALSNIVEAGFSAGVRLGEQIEKDMIAVPISPDMRMLVAAAPSYIEKHDIPKEPHDLLNHACINLHLDSADTNYIWEFQKDNYPVNIRVDGPFTSNDLDLALDAAINGLGIICAPSDTLLPAVEKGQLSLMLEEWCPEFPGYYIFFPSRRQMSPLLRTFIDSVRYTKNPQN